jgi:hypothetical protein
MERVMFRFRVISAVLAGCMCLAGVATAQAAETISNFHVAFTPNKLGSPTNASGGASIASTLPGELPEPVTGFTVKGPAGLTLDTTGTKTCNAKALENVGPSACPKESKAGFGGGMGALKLGSQIIEEPFTLDFFLGNNTPGHVVILLYVEAVSPVSIQLVFSANVVSEAKPYGLGFHFNIPLIPTLPGASDASVLSTHITLGAANAAYFEKVHGKRKLVHIKGLILPKTCPRGGFPVETEVTFLDGTTNDLKTSVPCPRKTGKKK